MLIEMIAPEQGAQLGRAITRGDHINGRRGGLAQSERHGLDLISDLLVERDGAVEVITREYLVTAQTRQCDF